MPLRCFSLCTPLRFLLLHSLALSGFLLSLLRPLRFCRSRLRVRPSLPRRLRLSGLLLGRFRRLGFPALNLAGAGRPRWRWWRSRR